MEKNQFQSDMLKALGHPTRLKVVKILSDKEQCVCELAPALNTEQSNLSKHLSVLKKAGVLVSRKDGLKVIYAIKHFEIVAIVKILEDITKNEVSNLHKSLLGEEIK
ncbi:metalloregulator ArsR/SmtB family transcription factor [Proteinivorax hydrogeniformans]|uniref:Metalloregulator ArsR/SmtB family transcription factor n=1 Tax=Proteinivorax hydrogeniformans TaxID=1826727 RepID=A0AAU8HWI2_9FIRM